MDGHDEYVGVDLEAEEGVGEGELDVGKRKDGRGRRRRGVWIVAGFDGFHAGRCGRHDVVVAVDAVICIIIHLESFILRLVDHRGSYRISVAGAAAAAEAVATGTKFRRW